MRYRGFEVREIEAGGRRSYELDPAIWRERGFEPAPIQLPYATVAEVLTWIDAMWQTPPQYEADRQLRAEYPDPPVGE